MNNTRSIDLLIETFPPWHSARSQCSLAWELIHVPNAQRLKMSRPPSLASDGMPRAAPRVAWLERVREHFRFRSETLSLAEDLVHRYREAQVVIKRLNRRIQNPLGTRGFVFISVVTGM